MSYEIDIKVYRGWYAKCCKLIIFSLFAICILLALNITAFVNRPHAVPYYTSMDGNMGQITPISNYETPTPLPNQQSNITAK